MTVEQEIQLQASYAYDDGVHAKAVETAKILFLKNMASEEISEVTGLSIEEIKSIVGKNKN